MTLVKLEPVCINPAYDVAEVRENVRISIKRGHPRLHQIPEFGKTKLDLPIALAVGSSHDWLVSQGVKLRYCIIVDAHSEVTASYIQNPSPETTYLVATHCAESVFKALDGFPVVMWHCISDSEKEFLNIIEPGYQGLGGGCTSGLRALGMAAVMGYTNMHLFGYDSCISKTGEGHAYPLIDEAVEKEGFNAEKTFKLRIGIDGPGEEEYECYGYHVAQAQNFETMITHHHNLFRCTFHGEGLMKDIYDKMMFAIKGEPQNVAA
jgi:hypothetical protein